MTITTRRCVHVRTYPQAVCLCVDLPPIALFLFGLNLSGGKPALNTYSEMVHVSVVPIYRHIVLRRPICRHKNV
jgi:ABC-type amino acid transport system permease subunit